jgi:hypothetical protein
MGTMLADKKLVVKSSSRSQPSAVTACSRSVPLVIAYPETFDAVLRSFPGRAGLIVYSINSAPSGL